MLGQSKVLGQVLRDAREIVRDHWGSTNVELSLGNTSGTHCASVAIGRVCGGDSLDDVSVAAHKVLLIAADVSVPETDKEVLRAVFEFNDAQVSRGPVLAAFDRAIEMVDGAASWTEKA